MNKHLKKLVYSIIGQIREFNRKIMENQVEKKYFISSTQKLHLGVGTHNLELVIPFDTYLDKELLKRSLLHLVQRQGLMRSVLVNEKGKLMWRQHAAPREIDIPYLDISDYEPRDQDKILFRVRLEKSLKTFPTHSFLYRAIVVKEILAMYLKKHLRPRSILYRIVVKMASFTRLLKKHCRKNSLIYRVLLIKKNLRQHLLLIRLDHIIGDDTSMDLIRNSILDYYNDRGERNWQEISPYHQYIEQVNLGPRGITPKQLCDLLEVDEYKLYSAIISNHIDKTQTKEVYRFNYRYRFKDEGDLSEARAWDISFILLIRLCKALFKVPKIPAKIIYYGRNYGGKTYFNTVGEFWDLIPMLVEVDEEEPLKMAQRASRLVELASRYNINFVSMFLNETLYESWKDVIDLVAPARLTPPESMILIDFLGKKTDPEEKRVSQTSPALSPKASKKLKKEGYINTRNQGGFLIYVHYTADTLFIDIETLLKIEGKHLKQMMDRQIRQIETKITAN